MNGQKQLEHVVVYIAGRIEQLIEDTARSLGLPTAELAHRVAEVLHAQESGQVLGLKHSVSGVSENGTGGDPSVSAVAVAERALKRAQDALPLTSNGRRTPNIRPEEAGWLRGEVARLRAAGVSWERISIELNRSEKAIKRAVDYNPSRSYNGSHWMQKPENKERVKREMDKRRKKMLAITKKARIGEGHKHLSREEWWRRYREARDKARKGK